MSILIMRTITCDGADCHQWIYESDEAGHVLRRMAKREGWKRRDGKDICPDCATPASVQGAADGEAQA